MSIVTLTSDFGLQDYYVGVIKGAMLCRNANLNIVDISHNIKTYDIVQAAFVLKNTYPSFPKGTIHIVSVNNFYGQDSHFIVLKHEGHYFIGPNNGIFSLVFDEVPDQKFKLPFPRGSLFPLKEVFAEAVGHITTDAPFEEIGEPIKEIVKRITLQPVISKSQIRGTVIHIDNYENAIINISSDLFKRIRKRREFALFFKRHDPIEELSVHYYDVPIGEILCRFNSANYLEIAIHMGKASSLLGLKQDDTVQIDFL